MNEEILNIEELVDIYQKAYLHVHETGEDAYNKEEIDIKIALLFIKYAQRHNASGKFEQVSEEADLIEDCQIYLMGVGNSSYFDYMLTDHRNKILLHKTLQDALQLYDKHYEAVMLRKKDASFLDKIQNDYAREKKWITDEIQELSDDLTSCKDKLSSFGLFALSRLRRVERTQLRELVEKREEEIGRLTDRLNTFEQEYRTHNDTYYKYMAKMGVEDERKISEYFFASHNEAFEEIYGISNVFEADRNWLVKKLDEVKAKIDADKETSDRLKRMLKEAQKNNDINN